MRKQVFRKNALLTLIATIGLTTIPAKAQDAAIAPPTVRTMIVEAAPLTISHQFFGRVRARETVDLAFEVGGRLAVGDTIAELERDVLERGVARAELQFDMAAREAARTRALAKSATGAATRAEDAETARSGRCRVARREGGAGGCDPDFF